MKIFRIAAVLVLAALLAGCSGGSIYSNYRELEQLMVIQTLGFDRTPGGVRLSASSGSDSAGGGGGSESGAEQSGSASVARLAAEAPSFSLAEEKMQDYSAREDLFCAHGVHRHRRSFGEGIGEAVSRLHRALDRSQARYSAFRRHKRHGI